jgi:hypothetical protein
MRWSTNSWLPLVSIFDGSQRTGREPIADFQAGFEDSCISLKESGAGDGYRKYRWRGLAFWNHEVASAAGAARDFCVKAML